jgi:hypothetical protein
VVALGDPRQPAPDPTEAQPPPDPAAAKPAAEPAFEPRPVEADQRAGHEPGGAPPPNRPDVADDAVGAVAQAAVHLAITGRTADDVERYVEHVAVERQSTIDAATVVVTVVAVVLEGEAGQWRDRAPVRLAVPVRIGSGDPVPLAAPWPLPPPSLEAAPPRAEPLDDDRREAAVLAALADAGYTQVELTELARLGTGLLRAAIVALAPGEAHARRLEVWLSGDPAPVVLGREPASDPDAHDRKEHP